MVDLIDVLVADHRAVEELFTELQSPTVDASRRAELRDRVIAELVRHSAAEERYLYPTARAALPGGDALADREQAEHAAAEPVIRALASVAPGDPRFDRLLAQLVTDIRGHVAEEETDLFPRLRIVCSDGELVALGEQARGIVR
jgi:hemerythrin superfamily protein